MADNVSFPWAGGSATGVGSYPGTDPAEALRVVLGELSLPHLPELPERGPGADLTGRTAALLVDLAVDLQPSGWRFADRPGRDVRRGLDHWARDLDTLEELAGGHTGPLKIQVCGPWTLAATIELRHGDRALADPGACRDLAESLAEGVAAHVREVRRRVPGAEVLLQVDEPGLPAVLAGRVPTASGFGRLRPVEAPVAEEALRRVLSAGGSWGEGTSEEGTSGGGAYPIVHCCAADVPYVLLRNAGAKALSIDASLIPERRDDVVGETIDAGIGLLLGVVPGRDTALPSLAATVKPVKDLWRRLGFKEAQLPQQVVLTPACGLAGASPGYVRAALARCREAATMLAEAPET